MTTTEKTAKLVKATEAHKAIYSLSEPIEYGDEEPQKTNFLWVSYADAPFSGPETYVFPCDESGKVLSWTELEGSFRGGNDHARALSGCGYELKEPAHADE